MTGTATRGLVIVMAGIVVLVLSIYCDQGRRVIAGESDAVRPGAAAGGTIHITSDKVTSDHNERWVEFIGHVRATQDDGVITADRIKIFYEPEKQGAEGTDSAAVEKMVAQGNVKIVFDKAAKTAMAEQAVYTLHDKVLVLSGGRPTVRAGDDVVQGEKITLFQAENKTLVEGGRDGQVEATFRSNGQGGLIK
ncbi:MAG: hypothetical protein JRI36_04830 [Deltaproteobacteria bacterium]|nr:hypothetical protein [Deltaproteobacteria bacterium]